MSGLTETTLEQTALDWFESLGWQIAFGPDISPDPSASPTRQAGGSACERQDYDQVVLIGRLQIALANINPNIPPAAVGEAVRKITRTESPSLIENNRPDIVIFINGLPLGVIELKNPADERATIRHAFNQLQTYKSDMAAAVSG